MLVQSAAKYLSVNNTMLYKQNVNNPTFGFVASVSNRNYSYLECSIKCIISLANVRNLYSLCCGGDNAFDDLRKIRAVKAYLTPLVGNRSR
mmetsp:Transcript_34527/g.83337  ORF Transcript_34527/g.83337 Transcript_34527/m.83337 type:complete len:91 (-) Transcript_34527:2882-3154(-)